MTIRELGRLLRARKISCVELLTERLKDIRARDRFHSFITLTEDCAHKEAAERDQELAEGRDRGPFHGIPIAYKDIVYTKGIRTTAGSLLYRDFVPSYDATVVQLLANAGAVSVGKANLHELAYGITSKNPHYGFVLNPRDTARVAGGSSGGSAAAVAAKFLPMSIGTDTGGSIRIPASFCGVVGLKPTYGRVSRHGVLPLSFSLDCVGPLANTAEDCALTMDAIAGPAKFAGEPRADLAGVRVGVPQNFFFARVDEQVEKAVRVAIAEMARLGAELIDVQVPDLGEVNALARIVQLSETSALYASQTDPSLFGADVWPLIQQGKLIAGHEYVNAQRLRTLYRKDFDALWQKIDVLAAPTTPIPAPRLEQTVVEIGGVEEDTRLACTRLVRAINYLGEPAISLPCGTADGSLPIGLQLISKPFSEPALLAIARTFERETGRLDGAPTAV